MEARGTPERSVSVQGIVDHNRNVGVLQHSAASGCHRWLARASDCRTCWKIDRDLSGLGVAADSGHALGQR